jgi:hypothetical protein
VTSPLADRALAADRKRYRAEVIVPGFTIET